ncbi:MAG: cation diffusion facilitator family transporter [Thermanaerothrix sp.]|nr:cation diffusion facilitator family transporter [Thermanaerothrix sp.]
MSCDCRAEGHHNSNHHHDGHGHHHHHHHVSAGASEGRLALALVLNLLITLAEVVGGLVSNSLALLSDAVHNLSDASSLGVSWLAMRIAKMERTPSHSFGFKRAEVLASLLNTVALMGIGVFLLVEAIRKFLHPDVISGGVMLSVAVVGLVGNLLTAWLLHRDSKESLNVRSAYLHVVMDALSSVGVIIAAILVMKFGWYWLDPLLTLGVSLYVLRESVPLLKESVHILMQGTPEGVDVEELVRQVEDLPEVLDMHHIHMWTTDGREIFLEAHVTLRDSANGQTDEILSSITSMIKGQFPIAHVTLQMEFSCCVGGPFECRGMDVKAV